LLGLDIIEVGTQVKGEKGKGQNKGEFVTKKEVVYFFTLEP